MHPHKSKINLNPNRMEDKKESKEMIINKTCKKIKENRNIPLLAS